jgi:catechol 2,3-dioxygenase-like lactoylglutathione lyase family enzyme
MEVNGIAHIFLTASNFERSRDFYRKLLPFLGLKPVIETETTYYCVGGRTAVGIRRRRRSMRAPRSSRSASACTTSASAPASAPTSTNCMPSF